VAIGGSRLGIDFGTSTTVAALRGPDQMIRPLLFDSSPLLASAVFAGPGQDLLTGEDAERAGLAFPAGLEPNPKRCVDESTVLLGERVCPVVDVIGAVLARVADEAVRVAGQRPATVVLTHPAAWSHTRLGVLRRAAASAGLGEVEFIAEPVAAAVYFATVLAHQIPPGRCLVVYDLGAGTFDISLVRRSAAGFEVVASAGLDDVGGLDLDAAVVGHARALSANATQEWRRLERPRTSADQQARHALWRGARAAKEQLSRHPAAELHVPLIGTEVRLTREEFERLALPYLGRTARLTSTVLREAGIPLRQIGGVFLVGGSSRIPLAATLLHRALGLAPTVIDQPELVVAVGSLHTVPTVGTVRPEHSREPAGGRTPSPVARDYGPHDFAGQWWSGPHDLAAAMTVEWEAAREVFRGPRGADLSLWLRNEVGDRTYPSNLMSGRAGTPQEADERIVTFVAHFAPDIRPRFHGRFADAAGIAEICECAMAGDEVAADLLAGLTEPVIRALAKHPCQPRHPGCTGPGCAVLAGAWTAYAQGRSVLDGTVPAAVKELKAAGVAREVVDGYTNGRMVPGLLRSVLDPAYTDEPYRALDRLPPVARPAWWQTLHDRAQTETGPARTALCLLLAELAEPAAAITAAELVWKRRVTAVGIGAVPGILSPVLVGGLIGSSVAGARVAQWLFGVTLAVLVLGEALLLLAMKPARTLRAGAAVVWSGVVVGALVAATYRNLLLHNWGWMGYCTCVPVVLVPFWLLSFADDARRPIRAAHSRVATTRARVGPAPTTGDDPHDEPAVEAVPASDAARVARMSARVLVVDGRPRYHLTDCTHLFGRKSEPLPVSEAVELGFTPCGRCRPANALLAEPHAF
jgi:hypothetical protein